MEARAPKCIWAAALAVVVCGCSGDAASVTGRISLDGEPVAGQEGIFGSVMFYPEDGSSAPATGAIDDSGRYELSTGANAGLKPGNYLVGVTVRRALPRKQDDLPPSALVSPARYADPKQSGLRAAVTAGDNEVNFDLRSTPTK